VIGPSARRTHGERGNRSPWAVIAGHCHVVRLTHHGTHSRRIFDLHVHLPKQILRLGVTGGGLLRARPATPWRRVRRSGARPPRSGTASPRRPAVPRRAAGGAVVTVSAGRRLGRGVGALQVGLTRRHGHRRDDLAVAHAVTRREEHLGRQRPAVGIVGPNARAIAALPTGGRSVLPAGHHRLFRGGRERARTEPRRLGGDLRGRPAPTGPQAAVRYPDATPAAFPAGSGPDSGQLRG
jgi:hypothetical protein